jgi:DNA-3-methyladenine glycosylase I
MAVMSDELLLTGADGLARCWWPGTDPRYVAYHDHEWGLPVADDTLLFEHLCLEAFQAGLAWITVLRKREAFRRAFAGWDLGAMARMGEADVARLMGDAGIVRNRVKIQAVLHNSRKALELKEECGSLCAFFWRFEGTRNGPPRFATRKEAPATSKESEALSAALKERGWRFVGPTGMYACMQAVGMVNDHLEGCCCRERVLSARAAFVCPTVFDGSGGTLPPTPPGFPGLLNRGVAQTPRAPS